jgi:hypothetical protein
MGAAWALRLEGGADAAGLSAYLPRSPLRLSLDSLGGGKKMGRSVDVVRKRREDEERMGAGLI